MNLGRQLLTWLGRHFLALVLILLVLIAGRSLLPWLQAEWAAARSLPTQQATIAEARQAFDAFAAERRAEAQRTAAELAEASAAALRARRAGIDPAIAQARAAQLGTADLALAAARGDAEAIFGHYRAGVEVALLERERGYIDALLAARAARREQAGLDARRAEATRRLEDSHARWAAANARAAEIARRPLAGPRDFICRNARPAVGCRNHDALMAARAERDAALAENRRARTEIAAIDAAQRSIAGAEALIEDTEGIFESQREELAGRAEDIEQAGAGNWLIWARRPILEVLPTAILILLGAMLAPVIGKALLYFVVAPVAGRRPPIRLVADDRGEVSPAAPVSAVSQRIAIDEGRELLVVPDAVQSTPHQAAKATRWLLSARMPLSSLASGMVALIRIRSERPDFVLVSATGSPLAEISPIDIAEGSSMVLRPRALRGVVQPIGRPMRISRQWRLGHLSAWLTFQFRYLVFHGPCTLIVQGSRGVRIEPAGGGRGINQAATIGFSAGLLYSVRRSEAFGAYLIGKQELFNDSFDGGPGFSLYEEMPREGQRSGLWGRGVSGLGDAALKVFGL